MICITKADFSQLSEAARAEVLAVVLGAKLVAPSLNESAKVDEALDQFNTGGLVDMTLEEMKVWIQSAAERTQAGLRIFAEQGPIVTEGMLNDAGIENVSHFLSRTTVRTRTMKGGQAILIASESNPGGDIRGRRYAVSSATHDALKRLFAPRA